MFLLYLSIYQFVNLVRSEDITRNEMGFWEAAKALLALASAIIFIMVLGVSEAEADADADACTATSCSADGPDIQFPFWKVGVPRHCGYPGFELFCKGNDTVLRLPSSASRDFLVTSIDYYSQTLSIVDPKNCIMELFLHINSSSSPFQFHFPYDDYNYIFLSCTANITSLGFDLVPCMSSGLGHHYVYIVSSTMDLDSLPEPCQLMKTFSYSDGFLPDGQEGPLSLYLTWQIPGCGVCARCGFKNKNSNETQCLDASSLSYYDYRESGEHTEGISIKHTIIGVCTSILVLVIIILGVCHFKKHNRNKGMENQIKVEEFLADYKSLKPTRYSYTDIKSITNRFKIKLGEGGYGTVFKGDLQNGKQVAVKILRRSTPDNGGDFQNEVSTIGRIHHVNVVRLLGFCADGYKRALIYEFMPNESLAKFIFSRGIHSDLLGWEKLLKIAIGIAKGIEYLHQGCEQRILHFDIKPHNILLDQNFTPKISDFGLAKLCSKEQSAISMTAARGTTGYIAPEVLSRNFGNVSYKSDVYSFGMLLLEMVGGRKNIDPTAENTSQVYFPEWIYNRLCQGGELGLRLAAAEDGMIARRLTTVALWCIQWYPVNRPCMKSVLQMLDGSMESLRMPPDPFASIPTAASDEAAALPDESHGTNLTTISEEIELVEEV